MIKLADISRMRNVEVWSPSKFVIERGRVRASSNSSEVNPASRLVSNLTSTRHFPKAAGLKSR